MDKNIRIQFRHWVFIDEMKFFGPGRMELLERIHMTYSRIEKFNRTDLSDPINL